MLDLLLFINTGVGVIFLRGGGGLKQNCANFNPPLRKISRYAPRLDLFAFTSSHSLKLHGNYWQYITIYRVTN